MGENYTAEFPPNVNIAKSSPIEIKQTQINDQTLTRLFATLKKMFINNIQQPCLLCGDVSTSHHCLCNDCTNDLPFICHHCYTCGLPLSNNQKHCGACIQLAPPYHQCIALLHYRSPIDYLMKQMKYHRQLTVADLFGSLLAYKIQENNPKLPELIIPVPLHAQRLQQRGYNQAVEIARPLSKKLNIPRDIKSCKRQLNTAPQFDLPPNERNKNLRNAFKVTQPITAKHVAIIDDIMTTGSTVSSFSQTLIDAGVERVDIWACARATIN